MNFESTSFRAPGGKSLGKKRQSPAEPALGGTRRKKTAVNAFVGEEAQLLSASLERTFNWRSKSARLADFEKIRSRELEEAIRKINGLLVPFLREWGLEEFVEIDAENIVLGDVKRDKALQEMAKDELGSYHSTDNRIRILTEWKAGRYQAFVKTVVHEMIHMQAFQSWQLLAEDEGPRQRRQGLRLYHQEEAESYAWLDEAITEELTKRFMDAHEKDIVILGGIRKPSVIMEKANTWIKKGDGHSYKVQRDFLQQIITGIHINGRKKYKTRDEVFRLFTNAALNGRLLPVARAIEKAKGRGTFRKLANLDINLNEKR